MRSGNDPRFGGRQIPPEIQKQFSDGTIRSDQLEQAVADYYRYWDAHGGDANDQLRAAFQGTTSTTANVRDALGRFSGLEQVSPDTGETRPQDADGKPMLTMNERIRAAVFNPAASPSFTLGGE